MVGGDNGLGCKISSFLSVSGDSGTVHRSEGLEEDATPNPALAREEIVASGE